MSGRFVDEMKTLMERRGFRSQLQFSTAVAGAEKARAEQGVLSSVLRGATPPPMHRAEKWGRALGLDGIELDRFLWLAIIDRLPDSMQSHWADFFDYHCRLIARVHQIESLLAESKHPAASNQPTPGRPPSGRRPVASASSASTDVPPKRRKNPSKPVPERSQ
jgi:hypothetical protein